MEWTVFFLSDQTGWHFGQFRVDTFLFFDVPIQRKRHNSRLTLHSLRPVGNKSRLLPTTKIGNYANIFIIFLINLLCFSSQSPPEHRERECRPSTTKS